jgi:hypothetical protein
MIKIIYTHTRVHILPLFFFTFLAPLWLLFTKGWPGYVRSTAEGEKNDDDQKKFEDARQEIPV